MSLFANAKPVEAPAPKGKKDETVIGIEGMEFYGSLDAAEKAITALKKTVGAEVKDEMAKHFIAVGCATKTRPANFKGGEGFVTASCEYRDRPAALSDDEIELLKKNGIPLVSKTPTAETFIFNPAYANDSELLERISAAIMAAKIPGLPADLIQKQTGRTTWHLADDAINVLFQKPRSVVTALFTVVGTMAIKATVKDDDVPSAFDRVKSLFGIKNDEKKAKKAKG